MKSFYFTTIIFTAGLLLSSCNLGASPPDQGAVSTSAALTIEALLTPAAVSLATQAAATEALATQALASTQTSAAACVDSATSTAWTRDNAIYDVEAVNTPFAPEKTFLMSWTFLNTGTCLWDNTYQMYFDSGTPLTSSINFALMDFGETVAPGQTVTVDIEMTAPAKAGEYESAWRLQSNRGESLMNFGVITKVGSVSSQSLKAPDDLRYTYDCTTGVVNITLIWIDLANDEDGFRIYRDGDKLAEISAGSTSYTDLAPGIGEYEYTVSAFNISGESPAKVLVKTSNCQ